MAIKEKFISELRSRRKQAVDGVEKKTEERRKKGQMTARDRVDGLFHAGSFQEFGIHAQHDCHNFGMESKSMPGDGVITGVGLVEGRSVASFSQDFMIGGGALGRVHAKKIAELMTYAQEMGLPLVGFNDSGGARIQEGVESLSGYGQVFFHNVLLSGVVPQIAVIAGPCAGGAAYSPALMDFLIMVRKSANMFICGPDVILAATGQKTTMEEIGSADAHASVSGNTHFTVDTDAQAIALVKKLLSYLPSNNVMDPPHRPTPTLDMKPDAGLSALVPEDPKSPMDVLKIIGRLVDDGDFLEVHQQWAKNIVIGFGRFQGVVAGIVANQPMVKAGTLDIDASDKAARFIRFCNAFNIPLVTLVDVPGFLPGVAQERGGIIRHGAKMLFAYAAATVPKITVIMRKAYGGAYLAMCSRDMGADMVFAWPCAEIAVMGAEGAVQILYKKDISAAADPKAKEAEYVAEYRSKFCTPYESAGRNLITDVIEPSETRAIVSRALRYSMAKRETRPPKKHGTIPL